MSAQQNTSNHVGCVVPPSPAPQPFASIGSIHRGIRSQNTIPPVRILPQIPRINMHQNRNIRNQNTILPIPQQAPVIIQPLNNDQINVKQKNKKRPKKNIEEHALLFLKWIQVLPSEGIDVSPFYFDKQKGGVFCTICQSKYQTGCVFVKKKKKKYKKRNMSFYLKSTNKTFF